MAFLNIPPKDNNTPFTATEFNYLIDKLNNRRLNELIDVQVGDAVDKNIIQHNGSGWVFAKITDEFYTKTEIISLIDGVDITIPENTFIDRFFITDEVGIATINNTDTITFGDGLVLDVANKKITLSDISITSISDFTDNSTNWNTAYDNSVVDITITGTSIKTITLTQQDGGTLSAPFNDMSGSGGDGNDFLNSASFDDTSGIITLLVSNQPNVTVDIDGRFSLIGHNHIIGDVTGLQDALNGKVDDGQVLTNVPANAVFTDSNTQLTLSDIEALGFVTGAHTINTDTQRTDEEIRDLASAQWIDGTNTVVVKDYVGNTIKINSTDTNTQLSKTDIQAMGFVDGAHTVNTDTQLTQAEVGVYATNEGFIKTYVDTNTQLSKADIEAMGFVDGAHTVDTNTQRSDADIQAIITLNTEGFIKSYVDTNTQLSLADIEAMGFVTGSHTVNTDTQLTQSEVGVYALAEGFIKSYIDTNTQLSKLDIEAMGFVDGAHTINTDTQLSQSEVGSYALAEGFIKTYIDTNTQLSQAEIEAMGFVTGAHTTDTNNYLTSVTGSGNGSMTFSRLGLTSLAFDATHNHDSRYGILTADNTWSGENTFAEDTRFNNEVIVLGGVNAGGGFSTALGNSFTSGSGSIYLSRVNQTIDASNYYLNLPRANGQLAVSVMGNLADGLGDIVIPNLPLLNTNNTWTNFNRFNGNTNFVDEVVFSGDVLIENVEGLSLEGGVIHNLDVGVFNTDSVNLGQMNTAIGVIDSRYLRSDTNDTMSGILTILDTVGYDTIGSGGRINLTGEYNISGAVLGSSPYIKASKSNATDQDYGFGLEFGVRPSGSVNTIKALRILDNGNIMLGNLLTDTISKLHLDESTGNTTVTIGSYTNGSSYGGNSNIEMLTNQYGQSNIWFGGRGIVQTNHLGRINYTRSGNSMNFYAGSTTIPSLILNSSSVTTTLPITASNFILNSDETLKENIKDYSVEDYIKIDFKTYNLKSNKGVKRVGVIAQELEVNNPELVTTDENGMKSVAYFDLLIAKIAELEARLEKIER